ncbi:hypothetical protein DEO72_LG3g190 [Vigna unguiculata]|uniref:Rx N-terminal domain-containing protein n=1 Tax=Vigna unguiculata TaxID=3917 RepID=A0A4D6LB43_VIGUN|nr:hypothetical protein DEO72_LG3g190 [Vigna unguiculata]
MAAEMVTGVLVSTFLERTIDTLASRLFDIFHQRKHKKKLRYLKMKLLAIDVVALDAEQKQFTDSRVRDWLLRAKDVVIDAEDLLDELDYELSKNQMEAESHSAAKKVWSSLNSSFLIENEIESRMAEVIDDLGDLADESNILGLKKGGGVEDVCIRIGVDEQEGIGVENVAAHLGKPKNVQVSMSSFHVEKSKEMNIQRLGQFNLHGRLTIDDLQNIENPSDALEADLKSKPHLVGLQFKWNFIGSSSVDSAKAEDVVENLRPSKYLKNLSIRNYIGKQFPNWLLHNSLPNLVSLVLDDCRSCERLPPLGLLPFLKELSIYRLDGIVSIDADFHGNNSSSFKSLQTLSFSDMRQWEKWDCQDVTGAFPRLEHFWIKNCPKLKAYLPKFVALKFLDVRHCEQLEALIVSAIELRLQDCGKLQLDCSTLKNLTMDGHDMAASSVAMVGHMLFNTSLTMLSICSPLESISDDCVSLRIFPLDFFPTLKRLELSGFPNLQMISQDHVHNHLGYLTIEKCPKFESLPANMHMRLPSLGRLHIADCPTLESFPDGGLPSNLKYITLWNCFRLVGLLKGALGDSSSLESLEISTPDAECFLDECLLPSSLTRLQFFDCPNLKKLDYKGLLQLSSLRELCLWECPNLQRLPEEGLPISISTLDIYN